MFIWNGGFTLSHGREGREILRNNGQAQTDVTAAYTDRLKGHLPPPATAVEMMPRRLLALATAVLLGSCGSDSTRSEPPTLAGTYHLINLPMVQATDMGTVWLPDTHWLSVASGTLVVNDDGTWTEIISLKDPHSPTAPERLLTSGGHWTAPAPPHVEFTDADGTPELDGDISALAALYLYDRRHFEDKQYSHTSTPKPCASSSPAPYVGCTRVQTLGSLMVRRRLRVPRRTLMQEAMEHGQGNAVHSAAHRIRRHKGDSTISRRTPR